MKTYSPHRDVQAYFDVLEPVFPDWLYDYINTKEMLHQQYISTTCGTIYSDLFESKFFYSSLDHSVAVALIVWHFTHDKKQTLAGLFHDIATPAFKHCIDFMNGDYTVEESTEEYTTKIIESSPEITRLLRRDNIKISEVDNYHIYTIADNDIPKLSADRLEYSLSNGLFLYNRFLTLAEVAGIYNDIEIETNEFSIPELGFKTKKQARKFVRVANALCIIYREDRTRYSMQLIADILKKLNLENKIQKSDLYTLKESDIIKIIESSSYADIFHAWQLAKRVISSETPPPKEFYSVHIDTKLRYIDPLCCGVRMSKSCQLAKKMIDKNLTYSTDNYTYLKNIKNFI